MANPKVGVLPRNFFNAFRDDPDFYLTKKNPDVVISIGGDGMLLSAFHMYEKELARVSFVRDSTRVDLRLLYGLFGQ